MSKLNRNKIKKMILQEMHMMGMGNMSIIPMQSLATCPSCGQSPCTCDDYGAPCPSCGQNPCECDGFPDPRPDMHMAHGHQHHSMLDKGSVSREDCCAAIKCLVECCECPVTKQAILDCCSDIMMGRYD